MKTTASLLRAIGFSVLGFLILLISVDSGDQWAYAEYPVLWVILGVFVLFVVAAEMIVAALQRMLYETLNPEQKKAYQLKEAKKKEKRFAWIKRKYAAMLDSKDILSEEEIMFDHEYDGIRELDNNLPPWWKYLFILTIIFAGWYLVYYQILGGPNQYDEYKREMAQAELAIAAYKEENPDLVDASSVEFLEDEADLSAGKKLYDVNCVACHAIDGGGGIGPNLTDEYWILGGGIKNIYHTISEGGRSGKGMVPWKDELKPNQIAQLASYVLTLQDNTPSDPKEPEGDKWEDGDKLIH